MFLSIHLGQAALSLAPSRTDRLAELSEGLGHRSLLDLMFKRQKDKDEIEEDDADREEERQRWVATSLSDNCTKKLVTLIERALLHRGLIIIVATIVGIDSHHHHCCHSHHSHCRLNCHSHRSRHCQA